MADGRASDPGPGQSAHPPGWREVILVGAVVVAVVLGLAVLTSVLPTSLQDVVFRTPLAIVVLAVGTVGLLVWIARRPAPRA